MDIVKMLQIRIATNNRYFYITIRSSNLYWNLKISSNLSFLMELINIYLFAILRNYNN